jgi:hypothetical protein
VPFLRVIRDKRGYETTYLMHWYREGTRQRSRILYVFRSPGGVRVGRESLEPEILRDIEANYPDIAFDWKAVLDNKQIVETAPEMRRPRKRRRSEDEGPAEPGSPKPHSGEGGPKSHPSTSARGALSNVEGHSGEGGPRPPQGGEGGSKPHRAEGGPKPQGGEGGRPAIPSAIEGATPDEQTAFLARWYPIVRDRIPQRTADPARREALLALAERMNPTAWTDADQIVAGLQQAGEALERLSRVFARRRRRPRRAKGPDKSGQREARAEPASPKPHPSTSARGALSDVEGQDGEGGQPVPDIPPPEE